ncbi:MAG: hypothetical protein DI533_00925 [Cereibacter sphaeroides]|uniref:ABM domain-containing protein n=1 Tax=Cereibacter sphaeroides TaxID=1063 RepID=A0A2W5SBQ9_CERSP|nr:MAG: hypothetical protein DI533_00925 [Cereibacter sphaeroides]
MTALPALTALLTYRLNGAAAEFSAAAGHMAERVRTDGDPGVLTYRFFVDEGSARAVVDYRDPAAWIAHHDMIMGWPEMAELRRVATLSEITFLGEVSGAMLDWLSRSGLKAEVRHGARLTAGFIRD